MNGAFGALGDDISSLQINPAGSALFNYNHFSITGNVQIQKNKSTFMGNTSEAKESNLEVPSFGAVFVIDSKNQDQSLKKITIGLGYHSNARFNDRYFSSGISNQSVTGYFLDHANYGFNGGSVPLGLVQTMENESIGDLYDHLNSIPNGFSAQQAMLAYQGYLINDDNNGYVLNGSGNSFYQENETYITGFNNQLTGNIGFDFNKKLYLGANLNLHFVDYMTSTAIYEENISATEGYKELLFNNHTYTYGSGFSFSLRSEEHTSELQSRPHLVCRLLLEKKNKTIPHAAALCRDKAARLQTPSHVHRSISTRCQRTPPALTPSCH